MKKNLAFAMAITAGLCFAGSGQVKPAFAGHWEEVPNPYSNPWGNTNDPNYNNWLTEQQDRKDGAGSYDFFRQDFSGTTEYQGSTDWAASPDDIGTGFFDTMITNVEGGSIHHQTTGKIRTKFKWVRDLDENMQPDPNDNPPDFLTLKITASAWAAAGSDTSMQARNTGKEQVAVSAMGEAPTSSDHDYQDWMSGAYMTSNDAHAKKLVMVPTNGNDIVYGPWVNLGATATVDGGRVLSHYDEMMGSWDEYLPGGTQLSLTYNAQIDTRKLFLHRANAINETTDEDGNVHGDTTFSYLTQPSNTLTTNSQVFHPTFEGSWTNGTSSPDVTWAWTPQNLIDQSVPIISPQTQDTGTFATSTGTSYLDTDAGDDSGWTGTADSPQESSLKYEATDNGDGAKATATYFLTVHDEWELDASREDSRYFMEQHDMGVASACPGDPNVNDCPANASVSASFSVTPQIGGGVSGSLGVNIPIINGIGGSINLGGNVNGSLSVTGEVSGTSNWPTLTLTPGQSAVPVLNVYADHKEYDFRHYTPAGRDLNVGTNGIKTVTTNSFKGMSIGNMLEMTWRYIIEED